MRCLLALACVVLTTQVQAGDDIKTYVRYQNERLRTYEDAVAYHNQTKNKVFVWVNIADSDELFARWSITKDQGYNVFVKDFVGMTKGLVVGADMNGKFVQLSTVDWSDPNFNSKIAPSMPTSYIPSYAQPVPSYNYTQPSYVCPTGNCPTYSTR